MITISYCTVTVDAYPSTQPVPLGTTVVFVCRVVGIPESSRALNYEWSCPNGTCDVSSEPPRSRIVKGNTLTVNVVGEYDAGEYRCTVTVTEEENSQTSSYNITVSGEHIKWLYIDFYFFCSKNKIGM